jgi:hypothetical protein
VLAEKVVDQGETFIVKQIFKGIEPQDVVLILDTGIEVWADQEKTEIKLKLLVHKQSKLDRTGTGFANALKAPYEQAVRLAFSSVGDRELLLALPHHNPAIEPLRELVERFESLIEIITAKRFAFSHSIEFPRDLFVSASYADTGARSITLVSSWDAQLPLQPIEQTGCVAIEFHSTASFPERFEIGSMKNCTVAQARAMVNTFIERMSAKQDE